MSDTFGPPTLEMDAFSLDHTRDGRDGETTTTLRGTGEGRAETTDTAAPSERGDETIRYRVLHIDDEMEFTEIAARKLAKHDIEVVGATCVADAMAHLRDDPATIDCVVNDDPMPGRDGVDLYEAVREVDGELPFGFFTSHRIADIDLDPEAEAMIEYLPKRGAGQLEAHDTSVLTTINEA